MELIEKISAAGVVGAGGAGFPTHVKLKCQAEHFIVNGIECEPLLRTDRHTMERHAPEIVETVQTIQKHLGAAKATIALKRHYHEAAKAISDAAAGTGVEVYLSESFYPAGDEQNLVYCITGKTVPTGGIPLDVGCVVSNVSTVLNIHNALQGKPVTHKLVTIAGAVAHPITVEAPIGAPLALLLEAAGGTTCDCQFIVGGPLMGKLTDDLSQSVTKTTGGLLAIPKGHPLLQKKTPSPARDQVLARAVCCQCSMCTQMCPRNAMGLHVEPHKAMRALASGNDALLGDHNGIFSCCDCGICTYYACNFGLKPSVAMQQAKGRLQRQGIKPRKEVKYAPDGGIENKRVPTERMLLRLDLKQFDGDAPMGPAITADAVRIPLKMHIGAPNKPVVQQGDRVTCGQLISEPTGLGARIHASIDGVVAAVTADYIEIRK